ncbi:hypothetical protein T4E_3873 [Trichinella pseudospiralis]|uniref:Uncharacterized protein n=1 Tax=Trichinella pseudospiralis TaxID=6337 RepID=A0A0V0XN77_TRIPS|nr:hypothetical protein T4E_3873 [Trichinella pseudospiralis]
MAQVKEETWVAFMNIVSGFLGKKKDPEYGQLVNDMLENFEKLGCNLNLKLYFLHLHLDFFHRILLVIKNKITVGVSRAKQSRIERGGQCGDHLLSKGLDTLIKGTPTSIRSNLLYFVHSKTVYAILYALFCREHCIAQYVDTHGAALYPVYQFLLVSSCRPVIGKFFVQSTPYDFPWRLINPLWVP